MYYYVLQKGFLLGEVVSHVTDTISDSQIRGEKTETQISEYICLIDTSQVVGLET